MKFYPNQETGMDDQSARCDVAVSEGWGITIANRDRDSIIEGCNSLLSYNYNHDNDRKSSGAIELATELLSKR